MTLKSSKLFTTISSFTLFLFVSTLHASGSYINEPTGFRGIAWGAPLSENKDEMVYVRTNVGIDIYNRKNSKMSIGAASLSKLNYGYSQSRLSNIYINTSDDKNYALLMNELKKQFGPGPWRGDIGTVYPFKDGVGIYSTQQMHVFKKKVHAEIDEKMKVFKEQLLKNNSKTKPESDF